MQRDTKYQGKVIDVGVDHVVLPNGVSTTLEIIRHPGGAAVVALNRRDEVCLLRQYRHAANGWLWELPAGKIDSEEDPGVTARRELAEEAGVSAARWRSLGAMVSSPGVFTEVVYLFLATDLEWTERSPEPDELIEVHWVHFDEAIRRALLAPPAPDAIWDAKSALALLRADAMRREGSR